MLHVDRALEVGEPPRMGADSHMAGRASTEQVFIALAAAGAPAAGGTGVAGVAAGSCGIPPGLGFTVEMWRAIWLLRIMAPADVVAENGHVIRVTSSDRGGVLLDGGRIQLKFDDSVEYFTAVVRIDPRVLGAKASPHRPGGSLPRDSKGGRGSGRGRPPC